MSGFGMWVYQNEQLKNMFIVVINKGMEWYGACFGMRQEKFAMNTVAMDVKFAFRILRKSPDFVLGAVIALALGIGANTAIFSVVYATLIRSLPYKDADRLVMVWER